jgi:hypothetical protein
MQRLLFMLKLEKRTKLIKKILLLKWALLLAIAASSYIGPSSFSWAADAKEKPQFAMKSLTYFAEVAQHPRVQEDLRRTEQVVQLMTVGPSGPSDYEVILTGRPTPANTPGSTLYLSLFREIVFGNISYAENILKGQERVFEWLVRGKLAGYKTVLLLDPSHSDLAQMILSNWIQADGFMRRFNIMVAHEGQWFSHPDQYISVISETDTEQFRRLHELGGVISSESLKKVHSHEQAKLILMDTPAHIRCLATSRKQ